jgi:hypothetical protein
MRFSRHTQNKKIRHFARAINIAECLVTGSSVFTSCGQDIKDLKLSYFQASPHAYWKDENLEVLFQEHGGFARVGLPSRTPARANGRPFCRSPTQNRVSGRKVSIQPDNHARRFHARRPSTDKPASRLTASMPYFQASIRGMLFLMASKGISFSMPHRAIR